MPMEMGIQQIPLADRIPALADCVRRARQNKEAATREEAEWTDQLALAESEGIGQGIPVSGLIEQNPYLAGQAEPAPASAQGDLVDPNTGKSDGDA